MTAYDSDGVPMSGLDLEEGLTFTLSWNKTSVGGGETPVCGYWDFQEEVRHDEVWHEFRKKKVNLTFVQIQGWSSRGCVAISKNDSGTSSSSLTCQCRHLTNFAVVLDLADEAELVSIEKILTYLDLPHFLSLLN